MLKIDGLDKLMRELETAQEAIGGLEGELGTVSFDPHDPGSIEGAIQEVGRLVDERLGVYASNPFVAPLIDGLKETQRNAILERAAAARLERD
jgi:hypothetical protein